MTGPIKKVALNERAAVKKAREKENGKERKRRKRERRGFL